MFVAALIVIGVFLAGCGGSSPSGASGPSRPAQFRKQFLDFAGCMRSHGLAGYPDPQFSSSGNSFGVKISPGTLNPDTPAFESADHACHGLLPDGGSPPPSAASAAQRAQALTFADCVRSHGVPDFPDPGRDGGFDLPAQVDQQAPQFKRAMQACANVQPNSLLISQRSGGA